MNRSTNILGFAFLALAATLALTITMRNSPAPSETSEARRNTESNSARGTPIAATHSAALRRKAAARNPAHDPLKVSVSDDWLATLSPIEQQNWLARASEVEREASDRLERLTTSLDLNSTQRRKLFPALVRSTSGYDPAMIVGGAIVAGDPSLTPDEEVHSLLEPDQQTQLEDQEVQRQLWWQDVIEKLEADLTDSTGGPASDGTQPPADLQPVDEERTAPDARESGSLFDRLTPR